MGKNTEAEEQFVFGNVDEGDSRGERRLASDSQVRDRRVIPRVADPQIKDYARQLVIICRTWVALSCIYAVALLSLHLNAPNVAQARALFFFVCVGIVAIAVHRLGKTLSSYVENESKSRLLAVFERLFQLLLAVSIVATVFAVAHLLLI